MSDRETGMVPDPMRENALIAARRACEAGTPVLIQDDANRENEADIVVAAQKVTAEHVNAAIRFGRGLVCVALAPEIADRLGIAAIKTQFHGTFDTAFTLSVDVREGITTGISANERALTIRALANPSSTLQDFVIPGHVFPVRADPQGVVARAGHTEAATDLARLAGLLPAAMICEVLDDNGRPLRGEALEQFAVTHAWPLVRIQDIIDERLLSERLASIEAGAFLPTAFGQFEALVYSMPGSLSAVVLVRRGANVHWGGGTLVRLHSECFTGDVLRSLRCDCGGQLMNALERIDAEGEGVLVYLPQEGRGIGLVEKIRAYALQERGFDTVEANIHLGHPADARSYGFAAQILRHLGIRSVRLLTNNPAKMDGLSYYGIRVVERVTILPVVTPYNAGYLETKKERLGHLIETALM